MSGLILKCMNSCTLSDNIAPFCGIPTVHIALKTKVHPRTVALRNTHISDLLGAITKSLQCEAGCLGILYDNSLLKLNRV